MPDLIEQEDGVEPLISPPNELQSVAQINATPSVQQNFISGKYHFFLK
jgi:hypothetical protein